jgi:hypothetical protein
VQCGRSYVEKLRDCPFKGGDVASAPDVAKAQAFWHIGWLEVWGLELPAAARTGKNQTI